MTATQVHVGMAEIQVVKGSGVLTCLGLGSCIGVCAFDANAQVGGMAHIMLPEAFADKSNDRPGKFADTGIPALIEMMERLGATRASIRIAIAGGAQVFKFGANANSRLDVGARNSVAVAEQLKKLGLKLVAEDTGGNLGRTVTFEVESGQVKVRSISQPERPLCTLKK